MAKQKEKQSKEYDSQDHLPKLIVVALMANKVLESKQGYVQKSRYRSVVSNRSLHELQEALNALSEIGK